MKKHFQVGAFLFWGLLLCIVPVLCDVQYTLPGGSSTAAFILNGTNALQVVTLTFTNAGVSRTLSFDGAKFMLQTNLNVQGDVVVNTNFPGGNITLTSDGGAMGRIVSLGSIAFEAGAIQMRMQPNIFALTPAYDSIIDLGTDAFDPHERFRNLFLLGNSYLLGTNFADCFSNTNAAKVNTFLGGITLNGTNMPTKDYVDSVAGGSYRLWSNVTLNATLTSAIPSIQTNIHVALPASYRGCEFFIRGKGYLMSAVPNFVGLRINNDGAANYNDTLWWTDTAIYRWVHTGASSNMVAALGAGGPTTKIIFPSLGVADALGQPWHGDGWIQAAPNGAVTFWGTMAGNWVGSAAGTSLTLFTTTANMFTNGFSVDVFVWP